jgi:hypothetical protein
MISTLVFCSLAAAAANAPGRSGTRCFFRRRTFPSTNGWALCEFDNYCLDLPIVAAVNALGGVSQQAANSDDDVLALQVPRTTVMPTMRQLGARSHWEDA